MRNVHRNITNASILCLVLAACICCTIVEFQSGNPEYELDTSIAVCLILSALIGWFLYRSVLWKRTKNIQNYLNSQSSRIAAEETLDYFMQNAPEFHGMQYSPLFLCGRNLMGLEFAEVKKIKGYGKTHSYAKKFFIPVFKLNYLTLWMCDGAPNVTLSFWRESEVDAVIGLLKQVYPFLPEYQAE